MNDEIKEIYISVSNWIHTHDDMGVVKANIVFEKNITQEEYNKMQHSNLILCGKDYITNLQQEIEKLNDDKRSMLVQLYKANDNRDKVKQENERLKEELNDITNISYKDYNVWLTERHYLDTLNEFANDIKYKIAPNLADTYRDDIKSALKHTIKYVKDNYKQETLEDYKSRCEKAIEYIEDNTYYKSHKGYVDLNDLLNILQNGSDKE